MYSKTLVAGWGDMDFKAAPLLKSAGGGLDPEATEPFVVLRAGVPGR